eukprot:677261-Pyramimonas_sp.AAC.1
MQALWALSPEARRGAPNSPPQSKIAGVVAGVDPSNRRQSAAEELWKQDVCEQLSLASGRPGAALAWLREVDGDGAAYEQLVHSVGYDAFEAKLVSALSGALRDDSFKPRVNAHAGEARARRCLVERRHILFVLLDRYRLVEAGGAPLGAHRRAGRGAPNKTYQWRSDGLQKILERQRLST